jgi:hypothetical protein
VKIEKFMQLNFSITKRALKFHERMLKIKFHHKLNEKKIKIPENVECHKR